MHCSVAAAVFSLTTYQPSASQVNGSKAQWVIEVLCDSDGGGGVPDSISALVICGGSLSNTADQTQDCLGQLLAINILQKKGSSSWCEVPDTPDIGPVTCRRGKMQWTVCSSVASH